jgi:capsular exopolysaccharide synthesis family protein
MFQFFKFSVFQFFRFLSMATPYIADTQQDETVGRIPDWREILAILMERAWVGVAVALIVFSLFYIQLKRSVPYYRSTAVLLVDAQIPRILNYQDVVSLNVRNLEYFNTVINTLHSRQMMEMAVQQGDLMTRPEFFPGATGVVQKAALARNLISIQPVEKSRLIHVTAEHPDPQVASDLANAMARAYIQQDLDNRMNTSLQAVEWLRVKAVEYREKLEKGLLELQEYREEAGSVSLEEDQNIVISKLKSLNAALTSAQTARIDAESHWKAVSALADSGLPRIQLADQLNDETVSRRLAEWRGQQQRVAELRQRYKPDYPDLRETVEIEKGLKEKFEVACDQAVSSLKTTYETLKVREEGLRKALEQQEKLAFSLSRQLVRYNDLKRNVEADQEIYQSMISRMKETSISETLPTEVIRLAEEARPASRPFRPQPRQAIMRGILVGLVLGVAVIFILYYSDHRFRRNEEVERALGAPVLTSLPLISRKTVHERGVVCHLDPSGEVAEAFRTLRAITQVNPSIQNAQVFLVTSSQPGEGKSLVSTNLAISFSQDGRKTLLVGGDLRRPAFKHIFEVDKMPRGLSDVLKGDVSWTDVLCKDLVPGLDVVAAGSIPSQPAELLGNPLMDRFMDEARKTYDRIVIDSSPMMGVSDALLLMQHADGVLFVVRNGVTHSLGATHAMKRIVEGGAICLGAVMNGVDFKSLSNYYYYRRYGGYQYHNYAADAEEEKEIENE